MQEKEQEKEGEPENMVGSGAVENRGIRHVDKRSTKRCRCRQELLILAGGKNYKGKQREGREPVLYIFGRRLIWD